MADRLLVFTTDEGPTQAERMKLISTANGSAEGTDQQRTVRKIKLDHFHISGNRYFSDFPIDNSFSADDGDDNDGDNRMSTLFRPAMAFDFDCFGYLLHYLLPLTLLLTVPNTLSPFAFAPSSYRIPFSLHSYHSIFYRTPSPPSLSSSPSVSVGTDPPTPFFASQNHGTQHIQSQQLGRPIRNGRGGALLRRPKGQIWTILRRERAEKCAQWPKDRTGSITRCSS